MLNENQRQKVSIAEAKRVPQRHQPQRMGRREAIKEPKKAGGGNRSCGGERGGGQRVQNNYQEFDLDYSDSKDY
jgi:hypothetical protein